MLRVGLGKGGPLDRLGRGGDRHRRVARHGDEGVVERVRGMDRVDDLRGGSPALRRSLLEQAERVAIAVRHVDELGLLQGRCDRDRRRVRREPALHRDPHDQRGVVGLLRGEVPAGPVRRRGATHLRQGKHLRPVQGEHDGDDGDDEQRRQPDEGPGDPRPSSPGPGRHSRHGDIRCRSGGRPDTVRP
ncbi:hypothetical protein GALL_383480 [mine drainage metagenome]|uniref:Uncharacterized protein n=1 Tax=mine drainage metagenome TaxID=410659 RepID=A0A1J5QIV2_9ZZZZ